MNPIICPNYNIALQKCGLNVGLLCRSMPCNDEILSCKGEGCVKLMNPIILEITLRNDKTRVNMINPV